MSDLKAAGGLIGALAVIFLVFIFRPLTIAPPAVDPDHAFDTAQAFQRLQRILGDETPHPVDTPANDAVRERLVEEISALGFEPVVRDEFHCAHSHAPGDCARVRNVLFWVTAPGDNAVMLASHYDSVPTGPGAGDDGVGVAASLEIARILKGRDFQRPLLVLITDGEETGLLGAGAFVDNDPLAEKVGAVVSMEARGVRGLVSMFQTSRPNGRDIQIFNSGTRTARTSSLDADVYELLPNDTDLTKFLKLDIDAANFAIIGGAMFYHTPGDNLANLDKRSLFHMGASGLAAAQGYLAQSGDEPEGQMIYLDILGLTVLALPQILGPILTGLGALAALGAFLMRGRGGMVLPVFYPLIALALGLLFAVGAVMVIAMIRPEVSFGAAHPWALRAVQQAAGLLGAALGFVICWRGEARTRLMASGWFWLAALGFVAALLLPGAAVLFVPTTILLTAAAILTLVGRAQEARIAVIAGAIVFAVIIVPVTASAEVSLFVESAAPFVIAPIFLFILIAPLIAPEAEGAAGLAAGLAAPGRRAMIGGMLAVFIISTVAALMVPAYSPGAPRGLSITHMAGDAPGEAMWAISAAEPAPQAMARIAEFAPGRLESLPGSRLVAPAPDLAPSGFTIDVLDDDIAGGERIVTLAVTAPLADRMNMSLRDADGLKAYIINGRRVEVGAGKARRFRCYGRSCRAFEMVLHLDASVPAPSLTLISFQHGLGPEGDALKAARPDWAMPQHWGDLRGRSKKLPL